MSEEYIVLIYQGLLSVYNVLLANYALEYTRQ